MPTVSELESWSSAQEYPVPLDADGKIIDFLDPDKRRENKPEERVRQRMLRVLHHEFGYAKEVLGAERSVHIGTEVKRADVVIYHDSAAQAANDQGRILLLGETKPPSVKQPDGQLASYLSATSAQGGFWTNDDTIVFYRKNPGSNAIEEWPGIPKSGLAWDSIGKFRKKELIKPIDLKVAFRRCHNAMYRAGIDSEDIALDMVRVILAKVEDESSSNDTCDFHITADEYSAPRTKKQACERVRALFRTVRGKYRDVFSETEEITASDDQLAIVVSYLQPYTFIDAPYDVIGTAYETYVAAHLKGERGQYFTNRLVVSMMVEMAKPTDKDVILDPACGSGGFLLASMAFLFKKVDESGRAASAKELLKRNIVHNLYGIDTTPKLVKVAKANMLLGGDGHGGVIRGNSLAEYAKLSAAFVERAGRGKPSLILTNPPFGSGHELRIKERDILDGFQLGKMWDTDDTGNVIYSNELNTRGGGRAGTFVH